MNRKSRLPSAPTSDEAVAPGRLLDGAAIRHLPFFSGFDAKACDDIARMARVKRLPTGEAIFTQGAIPDAVFMVLSGRFKAVQVTPEGSEVVVRLPSAGDLIGHVSVFSDTPYPATPIAVTESLILAWTPAAFTDLMLRHPLLSLAVIRNMGTYIQEAHARLREVSTEKVEQRIAHAILRLAEQAGRPVKGGVEISFAITRQDIGLMTGATLHTVSRTLSAWERQGIIDGGRQHLVLRDANALRRISEASATPSGSR